MKKAISILLALAMILCLGTTVLADNTAITINDEAADAYEGYKLLNLTTSLKSGSHHPENCDGNHSDDCYNYAYSVNEKYLAVLQKETFDNGRNELWLAHGKPADFTGVSKELVIEYLNGQTRDNGDVSGTLRIVADRVYRAIKAAGIEADAKNMTGNADVVEKGYWLIADVTNKGGEYDANSLVMVDTRGENAITVTPKVAIPTVEKKVKDIEDSEDDSIVDNYWLDSADHDIGDEKIPFKLTATLPSNAQYYQSYKLTFHDTMAAGLTVNAESFVVLMYETKHKADVDTDMNDSVQDVTAFFTKNMAPADDCTFELTCDNVFAITGVTKDSTFVVYYEAKLNDAAVIGAAGNPNEVFLEFSNDPYNATSTGKTETDKVVVFTYQLTINKTDSHDHPLVGAGFTLSKKDVDGQYRVIGDEIVGGDITTFTWKGLDDGDYKLEETTVPSGYNKMADIAFSVSAAHSESAAEPVLISLDGDLMGAGVVETGAITKSIVNNTGAVLPETGAEGTVMLIFGGALLVVLAAVFMITRKKMSVYED